MIPTTMINPTKNGRQGGSFISANRPTDVAASQNFPGTFSSTPPGVRNSAIIEARNNRGTNVQIPYAR
jgi:hypothetical protein